MTWQDDYQTASFRGITFNVGSIVYSGGRKTVTHSYPRSGVSFEDNGSDTETLNISGFVVGDDFWTQWSDLKTALKIGGSALLVHPYEGTLDVYLDKFSATEVSRSGRYVNFNFKVFISALVELHSFKSAEQKIVADKQKLTEEADSWLDERYSLDRQPWKVIEDARNTLTNCFSGLDRARNSVNTLAEFKRQIESAKGDVISISLRAQAISNRMESLVNYGLDLFSFGSITKKDQFRELRQAIDLTLAPLVNVSDTVYTDNNLSKQVQIRLAYSLVGALASLIPVIEFKSIDEATEEQDALLTYIDTLANQTIVGDNVYGALRDIRASVFEYVQDEAIKLPELIEIEPDQGDNVLSVSYRHYGNIDEAEFITEVNELIHPAFLPQNTAIKLRTNDE